jgi:hypothetical protein
MHPSKFTEIMTIQEEEIIAKASESNVDSISDQSVSEED